MSDGTDIDYVSTSWNPLRGCTRRSSGCDHCWARRMAHRYAKPGEMFHGLTRDGEWTGEIQFDLKTLLQPFSWTRKRRVVATCFMGDLFHKNVDWDHIKTVFAMMSLARQHTFLLLTKRPHVTEDFLESLDSTSPLEDCFEAAHRVSGDDRFGLLGMPGIPWPLENVWLGVSTENQRAANRRVASLLRCEAAHYWVSGEPLLGGIDFESIVEEREGCPGVLNSLSGEWWPAVGDGEREYDAREEGPAIEWIVVSGETGPHARPMHPDWARNIQRQCDGAETPFFLKHMGEWGTPSEGVLKCLYGKSARSTQKYAEQLLARDGYRLMGSDTLPSRRAIWEREGAVWLSRQGKYMVGRRLDGRTFDDVPPEVRL